MSVTVITLESRSWFIDRSVTAYSLDFLNFTSSTSIFSAKLAVKMLFLVSRKLLVKYMDRFHSQGSIAWVHNQDSNLLYLVHNQAVT